MSNQLNQRQDRIFKIFTPVRCMNRDQLPRYVQGNMPDVERHLVEQHLVDCDLCSAAILTLQDKKHHDTFERYSAELSSYIHREYTPVPQQLKRKVRVRQKTGAAKDSLLSGFWVIMFIVIGGGSIFLLQQHLKNRPPMILASTRASDILPQTPMARIDSNYKGEQTSPVVTPAALRDTLHKAPVKDSVKKIAAITVKDTLKKAKVTDTAARVALKKPDSSVAKVETPKHEEPPAEKKQPEKPVEKKEVAPAPAEKEKPAEKPAAPGSPADETLFRAAMQYQQQGNIDNAIDGFRRLSTNYKYAERAKYQLALCYKTKGQNSKAKKLFKEIVKMDGNMKDQAQSQLDN